MNFIILCSLLQIALIVDAKYALPGSQVNASQTGSQ